MKCTNSRRKLSMGWKALLVWISAAVASGTSPNGRPRLAFQSTRTLPSPLAVGGEEGSKVVWQWTEDSDLDDPSFQFYQEEREPMAAAKPPRRRLWLGRMDDDSYRRSWSKVRPTHTVPPHKLRMERWNITLRWRHRRQRNGHDATLQMEFHENGYVRCRHPNRERRKTIPYVVGEWKLAPCGVVWTMTWDSNAHSFFAVLHPNPFGKHPKLFRGMVIRDRRGWVPSPRFLRPLVATFTGMGVGEDTADFSYRQRQFGSGG